MGTSTAWLRWLHKTARGHSISSKKASATHSAPLSFLKNGTVQLILAMGHSSSDSIPALRHPAACLSVGPGLMQSKTAAWCCSGKRRCVACCRCAGCATSLWGRAGAAVSPRRVLGSAWGWRAAQAGYPRAGESRDSEGDNGERWLWRGCLTF